MSRRQRGGGGGTGRAAIAALSFLLLLACDGGEQRQADGGFAYLLPVETEAGEFVFEVQTLSTLSDPAIMQGKAAQIFYRAEDWLGSQPPSRVNLIRRGDGVYLPADYASTLALVTYHHYERLYLQDKRLNIAHLIEWPRRVLVDSAEDSAFGADNAAFIDYAGQHISVLGFSKKLKMPVPFLGQIAAHEHFHAYFESLFKSSGLERRSLSAVQNSLLGNWNEGLADFRGFVFAGKTDSLEHLGMPELAYRQLDGPVRVDFLVPPQPPVGHLEVVMSSICAGTRCDSRILGAELGRGLVKLAKVLEAEIGDAVVARETVYSLVIDSLPEIFASLEKPGVAPLAPLLAAVKRQERKTPGLCARWWTEVFGPDHRSGKEKSPCAVK